MTHTRPVMSAHRGEAWSRPSAWRPSACPLTASAPHLQRCACGGGCPRCRGVTVSRPGDADEVAAERTAALALASPAGPRPAGAAAGVDAALPPALHPLRGGGRALPEAVRADLEPRFGADFGAVRVHADAPGAALAARYRAQAFTVGRDVVFGAGRFAPETSVGRALLAHELAHVAGQRGAVDGSHLQARVVDDDTHLPCRAAPERPGRVAVVRAAETEAASRAQAAATALRANPITETTRELLWTRFQLDYNDPRTRCRRVAAIADRFADIAREIRGTDAIYRCAVTDEPTDACRSGHPRAVMNPGLVRGSSFDLCTAFWADGPAGRALTILHEWAHFLFYTWRGLGDEAGSPFDNAECYGAFAFQLGGVSQADAGWMDTSCPVAGTPPPARDAAAIGGPCPSNRFAGVEVSGGYLGGLPGARSYGTAGFGWDMRFPLTRLHEWEVSLGPRLTAAIPTQGGARPPLAYLLGVRTALQFRYRPWRFGVNVGGYVEGGAALAPSTAPAEGGAYRFNPYAVGGATLGLNIPLGRQQALQLFGQVGGGVGLNTSDNTAFQLFQAGLGFGFEFQ